ncbi:6-hydroxymethylpterin diphosphokinase MptE-like protein [uncultured Brachyspira sp.]|uniref:motility associated factor glycosyltransferase family protein n=1 Tax=uncultured Brachyspira sp. TaxID=221953 RepID=UPI0027DD233F|nr:6-hydroxymethylpterin diphosphokinase MptE-like protein [uncultured Brachyspira sp.]
MSGNDIRIKNLDAIKKNIKAYPIDFLNLLKNKNDNFDISLELIETKSKKYSAKVFKNGKSIFLHSAYNPEKEANALINEIKKETEKDLDLVFIFGIGAGYLINALKKLNINIAVIEPSINFFNLLIDNFKLDKILEDNITFFIGGDDIEDIEKFISLTNTKKVKFFITRSYATLFNEEALFYQQKVLSIVDKKIININTISRFDKLWAYNIASNAAKISTHYGVNNFFDKYKNIPAIIVSAGPSLEKNIRKLKEIKNKALIIAVDTAMKPLFSHNISPHFIITIDPQKKNSKYFRNVNFKDSVLIAESSVDKEAIDSFNGAIYFINSIFPLAKYFMEELGDRGDITTGGSVSTAAYDFAIRIGANPIIMVGLDLSFPNYQTHIKGSYHEENFFTEIYKLDSYDSRIYKVLIAGNLKEEKNIYNEKVWTDSRFDMYKNWYEEQCEKNNKIKFYNATEGGIIINGMENIKLEELIKKFNDIEININKDDKNIERKNEILIKIKNGLIKIEGEISKIKPYVLNALELCEKINSELKRHRKVDKLLENLNEFDIKILNISKVNEFLGITMQKTIKAITEGFIFEDEKYDKSIVNSYKLYEAMKESIDFNRYIIKRALIKINKNIDEELE